MECAISSWTRPLRSANIVKLDKVPTMGLEITLEAMIHIPKQLLIKG